MLVIGMMISWCFAVFWWSAWIVQTARLGQALRKIERLKCDNFRGL